MFSWFLLALAVAAPQEEPAPPPFELRAVTFEVVDEEGQPWSDIQLRVDVGRQLVELDQGYRRWHSVRTEEVVTDAQGQASIAGLAPDAELFVYARRDDMACFASGSAADGTLRVEVQPTTDLEGKVTGKEQLVHASRVWLYGPRHLGLGSVSLDDEARWVHTQLPAGEIELLLRHSFWDVDRETMKLRPGKQLRAKTLNANGGYAPFQWPFVESTKARLIDARTRPIEGVNVRFWTIDDRLSGTSDEDGEIHLSVQGGEVIGYPPFLVDLSNLQVDDEERYEGRVRTRGKTTVFELRPKHRHRIEVIDEFDRVRTDLVLLVLTDGKYQLVHEAQPEEGGFALWLPDGEHTALALLQNGTLQELPLEVPEGLIAGPLRLPLRAGQ